MSDEEWFLLKQRYPIGCKFWAKVGRIRPFGIFVEISDRPDDSSKFLGLIDIGHIALYKEGSQELPLDTTQWAQEGTYIYCMVCYYREQGKQLGLSWLGESSQSEPD
jgi:hypothetical protein